MTYRLKHGLGSLLLLWLGMGAAVSLAQDSTSNRTSNRASAQPTTPQETSLTTAAAPAAPTDAEQLFAPLTPEGLLPTAVAQPLLDRYPAVMAARAGMTVAERQADILHSSPYEWTPRITSQRRNIKDGPDHREWNAGIGRTLRLPNKAAADDRIGEATIQEGQARYGEARHEAARTLLKYWLDWQVAAQAAQLAAQSRKFAEENLVLVEKRVRAGDAAALDANLARAELADQRRQENDAQTQLASAWSRLVAHFPGIPEQPTALPEPPPLLGETRLWQDHILANSDELKVIEERLRIARAAAERTHADRIPDPTVEVFTASEMGGNERLTGVMLNIPLPGSARSLRNDKAIAEIDVWREEVALKRRELEGRVAGDLAIARGALTSLRMASDNAGAMEENARLMQRAYTLGEAELQALLLARRQAADAENSALQARAAALHGYYGLLIDAHLVWDLAHD